MGLRGPQPKDPSKRARNNSADSSPLVQLEWEPGEEPELPTTWIDPDGVLHEIDWAPLTLDWWQNWCRAPQARIFSVSDWNSLLVTAFVAQSYFTTFQVKYATELRNREAMFGATPLDRLRLKMAWADAEKKSSQLAPPVGASGGPERYRGLRIAPDADAG